MFFQYLRNLLQCCTVWLQLSLILQVNTMSTTFSPALEKHFNGDDAFEQCLRVKGEYYRDLPSRKTCRFELDGQAYFIKTHLGVGFKEILKNVVQGKWPVTHALIEAEALKNLQEAGIPSLECVGSGKRGLNPARQQSFVITKALKDHIDLETLLLSDRLATISFQQRQSLIIQLANLARRFHDKGFVHHDFYLCHFLVDIDATQPTIKLIDCHRVVQLSHLPARYQIRDIAALYFSSLTCNVSERDKLRFLKYYFQAPLRDIFKRKFRFLQKLSQRTITLFRRVHGCDPGRGGACLYSPLSKLPFELQYLDLIFQQQANCIATSTLNDTYPIKINHESYFVKRYYAAGKGLRRVVGRSRLSGENENLRWFKKLGINIPEIVRFSEQRRWGRFKRGVLITKAVPGMNDLKQLKLDNPEVFCRRAWRLNLINNIAEITRLLHHHQFIHQDLKWRNILVSVEDASKIVFIDCPVGHKRYGHWFKRGVIKDLMSLDKEAKQFLSNTDRLRFYLRYLGKSRLDDCDKQHITAIQAAYR